MGFWVDARLPRRFETTRARTFVFAECASSHAARPAATSEKRSGTDGAQRRRSGACIAEEQSEECGNEGDANAKEGRVA